MRKNSPRKWLHACLDLLPVILIPVFMVYSHRHTIDGGSITREEPMTYNLAQLIENGKPINDDYWDTTNAYVENNIFVLDSGSEGDLQHELNINYIDNSVFYFTFDLSISTGEDNPSLEINITNNNDVLFYNDEFDFLEDFTLCNYVFNTSTSDTIINLSFLFSGSDLMYLKNIQLFNLTAIFGSGNEPSKEEFESLLTQDYYDYGVDYLVNYGTHQVTYNDTDIMSQFTYQLYNAVDKYFNMGNVFNMNGVYQWFNTNIFGGNAPISIYIVWNIVLYEFVMDLLFLLYGLFMWFIDMVQHIMDKPFKSIK